MTLSAKLACENLNEVCNKFLKNSTSNVKLITDGGPENQGEVKSFSQSSSNTINQMIAQKDIIFSNSMVEAANKRIKYDFLFTQPVLDFNGLIKLLKKSVQDYNKKPLVSLNSLAPNEVLDGKTRSKTFYAAEYQQARYVRIQENQQFDCEVSCI